MKRFSPLRILLPLSLLLLGACTPARELPSATRTDLTRVTKSVDGQGRTGIDGQVLVKETGEPLAGAYINIYPDAFTNLLGPSQFMSRPTDANGRYQIDLPPGTYYVVARKRMTGEPTGPLSPGDYYSSEHHRVITTVTAGRVALVDLSVVTMRAPMFFKKGSMDQETRTGIHGVLVDGEGNPVSGGFAMAYLDDNLQRLPDFPSTLSNERGEFTIYLPKGGTYYLGGRIHVWDMPRPGEPYGKFGGEPPTPVTVADDTFVDGIRIVLTPFTGTYEPGKSRRPF
ncbi:hypothetical protein JCM30471_28820 [Desulfuromonas carbonis]|uniref:carboxypeptidase-like regulatory domain-containing protein n=1 Tax=Desulfuromonas sp. DDH964 TaxID=1823759 RepID=UPI00078CC58E|nr:carboxypeptidase-like regulatory domain-containing protein [Desulfuromonas sp. DDH964]AMV71063.1 hypothetical protein DBW_0674 [Desulfuromonas sp. DDH964]